MKLMLLLTHTIVVLFKVRLRTPSPSFYFFLLNSKNRFSASSLSLRAFLLILPYGDIFNSVSNSLYIPSSTAYSPYFSTISFFILFLGAFGAFAPQIAHFEASLAASLNSLTRCLTYSIFVRSYTEYSLTTSSIIGIVNLEVTF